MMESAFRYSDGAEYTGRHQYDGGRGDSFFT